MAANNGLLFRLGRNLSSLSPQDDEERKRILKRVRDVRRQNRELAKASAVLAEKVKREGRNNGDVKRIRERFRAVLGVFEEALKFTMEKEWSGGVIGVVEMVGDVEEGRKERRRLVGGFAGDYGSLEDAGLNGTGQQQVQKQEMESQAVRNELLVNESDIQEREQKIIEIQASVNDVNAIFKDLAGMVGDQGVHIDHVELAVGESVQNISAAKRELERTKRRNQKRRKFFFCTLLCLAAILAVFLIILLS